MDFKITSNKQAARARCAGFTLTEVAFTVGITALCLGALAVFFVFSTHSFATLYNYVDLDDASRLAMDQFTRDVRQAVGVASFTTNNLVLRDTDGLKLSYTYNPKARTLTRVKEYRPPTVLLRECDRLNFTIGQRTPMANTMDVFTSATPKTAKVVNVSWSCSRKVFGLTEDTESAQSARIVIRKQGT